MGELQAAQVVRHLQPRQDPKTLRVAFVALDIGDLSGAQPFTRGPGMRTPAREPVPNRVLSAVTEGRIPEIMPERRRMDDRPEIGRMDLVLLQPVAGADLGSGTGPQAPRDARDFEGMREPRADVVVIRERKTWVLSCSRRKAEQKMIGHYRAENPNEPTRGDLASPGRADLRRAVLASASGRDSAPHRRRSLPNEKSGPNGSGVSGSGVTGAGVTVPGEPRCAG
jgi:hypothetical protein